MNASFQLLVYVKQEQFKMLWQDFTKKLSSYLWCFPLVAKCFGRTLQRNLVVTYGVFLWLHDLRSLGSWYVKGIDESLAGDRILQFPLIQYKYMVQEILDH